MDENDVRKIVDEELRSSFSKKIGDTPTDALQLTPKKYVDAQASVLAVSTLTFTNKRITPRVGSVLTASSFTIDTNSYDAFSFTALGSDISTVSMSGTPTDKQPLLVTFKASGADRNIQWDVTKVSNYGSPLPSVATSGKVTTVAFRYDINPSVFGCLASAQQP